MTYGEIIQCIEVFQERQETEAKEKLATNYNLAALIAQFTALSFNGKTIPSIQEVFPTQFSSGNDAELTKEDRLRMDMYKEQFIDFANRRNKLLHKEGDDLRK